MNKEKLGRFVAALRKEQGITQKELAEKLCLTDKAISKWERGLSYPDISMLEPLAEVLHVSVLEILEGERMEKDSSITVEEAAKVLDHSISIGDQEITRKHVKSKSIVLITCVVALLVLSLALNVMNYSKSSKNSSTDVNFISTSNSAYATTTSVTGGVVFARPDEAIKQLIKDMKKGSANQTVIEYLERLERNIERGVR